MQNIAIQVPFVHEFDDYHDIDHLADDLNEIAGAKPRVKCAEVAFDGRYWGLFWTGRKPKKAEIRTMLAESDFETDEESKIYR